MIEIYLLEQLSAFSRCGSLKAASEELHLTQPSLSRSMQKLEDSFCVPLFERKKNRIALNDNGKLAVQYADRILELNADMIRNVKMLDQSHRTIHIGASAPGPLMQYFPIFSSFYPGQSVTSDVRTEEELISGVKDTAYRLVFVTKKPEDPLLYCRFCLKESLYVCLPPDHPLSGRKSITFGEMNGEDFLMFSEVGVWDQVVRSTMPDSRFILQNNMEDLNQLVQYSSLPSFATDLSIRTSRSVLYPERIFIPFAEEQASIDFYAVCLGSQKASLRYFWDQLEDGAKSGTAR